MIEITCYDAVNGFQVEFWVEDKFNVINWFTYFKRFF
jgi:hypothetical protein